MEFYAKKLKNVSWLFLSISKLDMEVDFEI